MTFPTEPRKIHIPIYSLLYITEIWYNNTFLVVLQHIIYRPTRVDEIARWGERWTLTVRFVVSIKRQCAQACLFPATRSGMYSSGVIMTICTTPSRLIPHATADIVFRKESSKVFTSVSNICQWLDRSDEEVQDCPQRCDKPAQAN
jgi:hypothetical protein